LFFGVDVIFLAKAISTLPSSFRPCKTFPSSEKVAKVALASLIGNFVVKPKGVQEVFLKWLRKFISIN